MKVSKLRKYLHRLSYREIVERPVSEINPGLEVVRTGNGIQLNASNTNYSFGGLHRVFRKALREVTWQGRTFSKVLILGFGAGSVAAILQEELGFPCHIKGVELDPEVIRVGKEHFSTGRYDKLEVVKADAAEYLEQDSGKYDLIVVDVYIDFEVPASCESHEFVDQIYDHLMPGGVMLFNKMIYNHEAGVQAEALETKFRALPGRTHVIKIRESVLNKIIVFEK